MAVPGGSFLQWPALQMPPFDMTISTDASLLGWGATWLGTTIGGRWLPEEAKCHINLLELKAHLALQAFFQTYNEAPKHILLQMDNTTAVAYVNKQGGTKSHSQTAEALDLWASVLEAGCWISARHIPGATKSVADLASRQFNSYSDWTPILSSQGRSVCHLSQQPPSSICIKIPGSGSYVNRCVPVQLEPMEELDLCPSGASANDHPENSVQQGDSIDPRPTLER